tara:strand:- start:183 stop:383 length:201 start_codon:yes stop_codon:yes gene_type:complete
VHLVAALEELGNRLLQWAQVELLIIGQEVAGLEIDFLLMVEMVVLVVAAEALLKLKPMVVQAAAVQ